MPTSMKLLALLVSLITWVNTHQTGSEWFTLIHTNDIMSHFDEVGSTECSRVDHCFGGVARLVHLVKEEKKKSDNVLVVDGGGMFNTELIQRPSAEKFIKELIGLVGYDVICPGVPEILGGPGPIHEYISWYNQSNTTYICSDLHYKLNGLEDAATCKRWTIVTVGGLRVGFVSGISSRLQYYLRPLNRTGLSIDLDAVHFKKFIHHLYAEEHVDIIINMVALGHDANDAIVQQLSFTDIMVTSYMKGLYWNSPRGKENNPNQAGPHGEFINHPYPYRVTHSNGKNVHVVSAYHNLHYAGVIRFQVTDGAVSAFQTENPILLNGKKDAEAEKVMERLRPDLEAFLGGIVGQTDYFIDAGRRCKVQECVLGNIVADSILEAAYEPYRVHGDGPLIGWSKVTAAIVSSGDLLTIAPGYIYHEDVRMAYSHLNYIYILNVKGYLLLAALKSSTNELETSEDATMFQISGIRMSIKIDVKTKISRASEMNIICSVCIVPTFIPIDPLHTYRIAITDFLATTSPQGPYFENMDLVKKMNITVQEAMLGHIKRFSPIGQGIQSRSKIIYDGGTTLQAGNEKLGKSVGSKRIISISGLCYIWLSVAVLSCAM